MKKSIFLIMGIFLLSLVAGVSAKHVACGDVLTASTTLDSDVVCPAGFAGLALTLAADNVVLDGAGHSIVGAGSGIGVAIKASSWYFFAGCKRQHS